MKSCARCKNQKEESAFNRSAKCKSGLHPWCRDCSREYQSARARANGVPQKIILSKEEAKERRSARYKRWYSENKNYFKKRLDNPSIKVSVLMRTRVSNAVKRFSVLKSKSAPTAELIGCQIDRLVAHLESQFKDGMAWENYGPYWHIDHIRPCSSFDLSIESEQRKCFHYSNLQPLLKQENLVKNNKYAYQTTQQSPSPKEQDEDGKYPMVAGTRDPSQGRSPVPAQ